MAQYYELRTVTDKTRTLGADIARHLEARQDLGSAVIICDAPVTMLSVVRKQWLHLTRLIQNKRASTLNPEEILRLTHTIMHMQRMDFVAKDPSEVPEARVFFVHPSRLEALPTSCYTIYLCDPPSAKTLEDIAESLPSGGLLVNYDIGMSMSQLGLKPKSELEGNVLKQWQHLEQFLKHHRINPQNFSSQNPTQFAALDDALDILLGSSHEFLREANNFRQAIHLAQPITSIAANQQQLFTAVMRLAHRVQSLSPDSFNTYLLKTFGEKDSYFLRDNTARVAEFFTMPFTCTELDFED